MSGITTIVYDRNNLELYKPCDIVLYAPQHPYYLKKLYKGIINTEFEVIQKNVQFLASLVYFENDELDLIARKIT